MAKPSDTSANEKISCDVCRKEVPLSEAVVPEAEDYFAHFCGMECYTEWKQQSELAKQQGGKAKK